MLCVNVVHAAGGCVPADAAIPITAPADITPQ